MSSYKNFVKPGTPALQSARVLDQLRERIRCLHDSLSTEQVNVYWVLGVTRQSVIIVWLAECLAASASNFSVQR